MVSAVILLAVATASAQVVCTQTSQQTVMRQQAITDYIGEVDLSCSNPGQAAVTAQFALSLNTTVTNAVAPNAAAGSQVTEAAALVQPFTAPGSGNVSGTAEAVQGVVTTAGNPNNAIRFPNVVLPGASTYLIRFVNVRADATAPFTTVPSAAGNEIVAFLTANVASGGSITFTNPTTAGFVVGYIEPAVAVSVTDCGGTPLTGNIVLSGCSSGLTGAYGVTFKELQQTAFKTATDENGLGPITGGGVTICDGNAALCGKGNATVSNSVQLTAQWTIPAALVGNVHIWVSSNPTVATGTVAAALDTTNTALGSLPAITLLCPSGATPAWVELADAATETAAWDITTSDPGNLDSLTFAWAVSYEADLPGSGNSGIGLAAGLGPWAIFTAGQAPVPLASASVVRFTAPSADLFTGIAPSAPVGLTAAAGNGQVTLAWTASPGATSYDVYAGNIPGGERATPIATGVTATTYIATGLANGTPYYYKVTALSNDGASGFSNEASATPEGVQPPPGGQSTAGLYFVPVTPCRVADTRNASGPFGGPAMTAKSSRSFVVPQSACSIPATALAYSLNVTVVPAGPLSYLTLWPTGQGQPLVSTLNSGEGAVVANGAIVPAGTGGAVSVFVSDPTDVVLDVNGYFTASSGATSYAFYSATPCRVVDTRSATGQFGGPAIQAGLSRDFPIPLSSCPVPATAAAYSLNVTVVPEAAHLGYLTAWPTSQTQPNVSTLNSPTGKIVANAALVPAGTTNESISVFVTDPTNVLLDLDGYFAQPGNPNALTFYPVTPCRVADTRNAAGPFGGPELAGGTVRSFTVPAGACNIPLTAAAYSLNITVVPDGPLSYLTVWPEGLNQPGVSTLNSVDGSIVANAAIVPAGSSGAIAVFVTDPTQVIVDINGYFAP